MLNARQKAFMATLQADESFKECQASPDDAAAFAELIERKAKVGRLMDEFRAALERYREARHGSTVTIH
jgi:hypothetical protein